MAGESLSFFLRILFRVEKERKKGKKEKVKMEGVIQS